MPAPPEAGMSAVTVLRRPVGTDAITARAQAAPAGQWEAFPCALWVPFRADGDDETDGHWSNSGRWVALQEHGWHAGSQNPGPELWEFLASARADILSLAAENARLRNELDRTRQEAAA
jgi:hypothetical protein